MASGEAMMFNKPKPIYMQIDDNIRHYDICECGDYRHQHGEKRSGRGRCICIDCYVFRLHMKTVHVSARDVHPTLMLGD